jgi:hypothetical protein
MFKRRWNTVDRINPVHIPASDFWLLFIAAAKMPRSRRTDGGAHINT